MSQEPSSNARRHIGTKLALWPVLLSVIVAGCLGSRTADSATKRQPSRTVTLGFKPGTEINVTIRVTSNSKPRHRFGLTIRCPGNSALPCWGVAERAISRDPAKFMDGQIDPTCVGGVPAFEMQVTGSIGRTHFRLGEAVACGSPGVTAWYDLLRRYPTRPTWLRLAR
jgi:hypothetical protein